MSIAILVADSLHINQKNFSSFFKFIEQTKVYIEFESTHKEWWSLYGNYESKLNVLYEKIDTLTQLTEEALFSFKINDISLFHVCRAELLSYLSVKPNWFDCSYPTNIESLFHKLYQEDRTVLIQNMAAAWYWISFWNQKIIEANKQYQFCCIFSGSLIYQRSLMEILKLKPTKVMVMESLFTGNEYLCEERYSPIANRNDIIHKAVYNQLLQILKNENNYENERIKAINKMILMKNKNVQQPIEGELIEFNNNKKIITIIGQVVNDFSLLEVCGVGISSIKFYKDLIKLLIENDFNVILKTHPWEKQKNNIKSELTKEIMQDFISHLSNKQKKQVHIVSDYPIKKLFNQSNYIIGLNSQGLIEAAFEGFKPIQFGKAFYGGKGFTHDYNISEIEQMVMDLKNNKLNSVLTLSEFDKLEEFLTVLLQKHAISIFDSGLPLLRKKFSIYNTISLVEKGKSEQHYPVKDKNANTKVVLPKKEDIKGNHTTNKNNNIDKSQQPVVLENSEMKVSDSMELEQSQEQKTDVIILASDTKFETTIIDKQQRKLKKLKNDPRLFFAHSQYSVLRLFKYFFKSKNNI